MFVLWLDVKVGGIMWFFLRLTLFLFISFNASAFELTIESHSHKEIFKISPKKDNTDFVIEYSSSEVNHKRVITSNTWAKILSEFKKLAAQEIDSNCFKSSGVSSMRMRLADLEIMPKVCNEELFEKIKQVITLSLISGVEL